MCNDMILTITSGIMTVYIIYLLCQNPIVILNEKEISDKS